MPCWINQDAMPTSNFQPIILFDSECRYKFENLITNSADPDHGFFRGQLIWIYTVCKSRVYPGSAGQGLINIKVIRSKLRKTGWNSIHPSSYIGKVANTGKTRQKKKKKEKETVNTKKSRPIRLVLAEFVSMMLILKKPTDLDLHCLQLSLLLYSNNPDQVIWLAEN